MMRAYLPSVGGPADIIIGDSGTSLVTTIQLLPGNAGYISFGGAINKPYRAITSARTLDGTDHTVDCTANTFAVTLPTAVGVTGRVYNIKNSGAGTITVVAATSPSQQYIDNATTYSISKQYQSITVQSNGSNWIII